MESTTAPRPDIPAVAKAHWALSAVASAASRFVPLPLLDDLVRKRALRHAVSHTLAARGIDYSIDTVRPLYASESERGVLGRTTRSLAKSVLLFPVRRVARIAGAVHGTPRDTARPLLLARAVVRALDRGMLAADTVASDRLAEARQVRRAFEIAFHAIDDELLRAALGDLTSADLISRPRLGRLAESFDADFEAALEG